MDLLGTEDEYENPFFNELILSKVFSFLPLKELLELRLVRRCWGNNPYILKEISNNVILRFKTYSKLYAFVEFYKFNPTVRFEKFELCFMTPQQECGIPSNNSIVDFFSICGNTITYLKLTLDGFHMNASILQKLLLHDAQHLRTLHIYNLSYSEVYSKGFTKSKLTEAVSNLKLRKVIIEEFRKPAVEFFKDFFQIFWNNLEEIEIRCDCRSDWENQNGIWKEHSPLATSILKGLQMTSTSATSSLRVQTFIAGILDRDHFLLLKEMGDRKLLQLIRLEIYCPSKDVDAFLLKSFLETQGTSLKVLKILGNTLKLQRAVSATKISPSLQIIFDIPISKMVKLELLQLSGRDKDTPISIAPLNYSHCIKLNTLIVKGFANNILEDMNNYFPHFDTNSKACTSLRHLTMPAEIRDLELPFNVKKWFPNVTHLNITYPNDKLLSAIFEAFKDELEYLEVTLEAHENVEASFIGNESNSGISCLKKLRHLSLVVETDHLEIPSALSDHTATQALKQMTNLITLSIISCCWFDGSYSCNYISKEGQEELRQNLWNTRVIFAPSESVTCVIK